MIASKCGTKHILCKNIDNSYCYILANMHLVMTSKTNACLLLGISTNDNDIVNVLLRPHRHYAEIDKLDNFPDSDNKLIEKSYRLIEEDFKLLIEGFISDNAQHGYVTQHYLVMFLFPIIYYKFGLEVTMKIIEDLSLSSLLFPRTSYVYRDIILKEENTFLKNLLDRDFVLKQYESMILNIGSTWKLENNSCACVLEIIPEKNGGTGHATTMILTNDNKFCVLDDTTCLSDFKLYISERCIRLNYINVLFTEMTFINKLDEAVRNDEYLYSVVEVINTVNKNKLQFKGTEKEKKDLTIKYMPELSNIPVFSGGYKSYLFAYVSILIITLLIILFIISISRENRVNFLSFKNGNIKSEQIYTKKSCI